MNISTGGPHILLFERDQQLAALLISEFQLVGYECHTARTAVEVFDAIARYPIRLVLVNLAQAAAARREFWVALDTQRRGRGVQVFTFHCTNIAGYSYQDPDERSQTTMADMEVDGMLGIMNLVDAVRSRVSGTGSTANTNTNTMPRIPKVNASAFATSNASQSASSPPSVSTQPTMPQIPPLRTGSLPPNATPSTQTGSTAPSQSLLSADQPSAQTSPRTSASGTPAPLHTASQYSAPQQAPSLIPPQTPATTAESPPPSYTDKIRAVLYPNQRSWSSLNTGAPPASNPLPQNNRAAYDAAASPEPSSLPGSSSDSFALQKLQRESVSTERLDESGLAQLTRMVQEHRTEPRQDDSLSQSSAFQALTNPQRADNTMGIAAPSKPAEQPMTTPGPTHAPAAPLPSSGTSETASPPPLRAAPIQDLPNGRSLNGHSPEGVRRSETAARPAPDQQSAAEAPLPLASIASGITMPITHPASPSEQDATETNQQPEGEHPLTQEQLVQELVQLKTTLTASVQAGEQKTDTPKEQAISMAANNAVILDIVQSLPPMPAPPQQPQAAVLSGRATRSLGSVLLEGHLIPQSRLEVAQNIQRMLRGVDLNYQLGEILLMFKLLTPDQLLAASLVSYGLITTTQISALGRIRQELHSIGLEYDLENLLILFRILTPEQLREVRAGWQ